MSLPPFQRVLDTHAADVHRFLVAAVGPVDADDCFQETFLSALRAYPRLRPDSDLRAWVLTIAHRKALDHHRARTRRPVPASGTLPEAAAPPPAAARDDTLWDRVHGLPAKQRAAVLLRFAADLSHREVGTVLGCSEAAARRSAHEGLKKLRQEHRA
ncbi:RNA polymerase sigma factor [Paraconexibacter sp.]|uniref:RNA polymerase sigma factor n=1 Tax=Paraconexibacter sp. TaxID=2949640 RepID=UPI003561A128